MLSIKSISACNSAALAQYYDALAQVDDYHAAGTEPPGYWLGSGSLQLGLTGELAPGELVEILRGHNPKTLEPLSRENGDHKPGWDCTFSAPKSASAIWAIADSELRAAIESAHKSAVEYGVDYLEREAVFTRHGRGGAEHRPVLDSGGIIGAAFDHSSSRAQDPQLHTHVLIANISPRGRCIDLDTSHKMAAGALYRAELSSRLRELGFEIARDKDSFTIVGVPPALLDRWSQRRAEVLAEMERSGFSTAKASDIATLATRAVKEHAPRNELFRDWRAQALEHGFSAQSVRDLIRDRSHAPDASQPLATPGQIMSNLTEKNATVTRLQILHQTAIEAQSNVGAQYAERYAQEIVHSDAVVRLTIDPGATRNDWHKAGERFTTKEMLEVENALLARARTMAAVGDHRVVGAAIEKALESRATITAQQSEAVRHLVSDTGAVSVLEGHAGSGKTFVLGAAREAWEQAGYQVLGTAVSNRATRQLAEETGIPSWNTTKLEIQCQSKRIIFDHQTILVIDEAGMQSTRQLAALLERAESVGAKVVLVGDTRQLQAIDAGAPMRAIAEAIGSYSLTEVRRQRDPEERKTAGLFREGHAAEALQRLEQSGRLHVSRDMSKARSLAAEKLLADIDCGKTSICVAATRMDVSEINRSVRNELKLRGDIAREGVIVQTTSGFREFSAGDRVVFGKKADFGAYPCSRSSGASSVWNGAIGTIVSAADKEKYAAELRVRLDHSREEVTVQTKAFPHIDHAYATTTHKAQGVSVDTCHVVAGDIAGREWAYVAGSRHRESVHFYTSKEVVGGLAAEMSRARQKDMATDYAREGVDAGPESRETNHSDHSFSR